MLLDTMKRALYVESTVEYELVFHGVSEQQRGQSTLTMSFFRIIEAGARDPAAAKGLGEQKPDGSLDALRPCLA